MSGGRARVDEERTGDDADFRLQTDARTLIELVTGTAGPLGLMMRGRLRIRGKRRRALKLRQMSSGDLSMAEVVESGGTLEPDILYRSLPYLIDPEWTMGHEFTVRYVVTGEGGGTWYVSVRDGEQLEVTEELPEGRELAGTASVGFDSYQRMASGQVSPSQAMQNQLTEIEGKIHPITLLGRWIARAQGADDAELKREKKQRKLQEEQGESLRQRRRGRSGSGRSRPRCRGRRPRRQRAARLPPALRALGAPELEGHRARLHGRPGAVGDDAARGAGVHDLEPRLLLRGRGAGDGRPRPVPAGCAQRRDRAVPRHPARGRGAPRRVLRPLRRRGDVPLRRRLPRPHARGGEDPALTLARGVRRRAARRGEADPGEAGRPRPVRGGHHDLPHGRRGVPRRHRARR